MLGLVAGVTGGVVVTSRVVVAAEVVARLALRGLDLLPEVAAGRVVGDRALGLFRVVVGELGQLVESFEIADGAACGELEDEFRRFGDADSLRYPLFRTRKPLGNFLRAGTIDQPGD